MGVQIELFVLVSFFQNVTLMLFIDFLFIIHILLSLNGRFVSMTENLIVT